MLANLYMYGIIGVESSFQHVPEKCESKRAYVI